MWQALHDAWWRLATQRTPHSSFVDTLACGALTTCSFAYQALVTLRNAAYDLGWSRKVQLPCRVVSVGNLTVGGTGKTTCVAFIAQRLTARGRRVAILSRGYGGSRRVYCLQWQDGRLQVNGGESERLDGLADEPQLLARCLEGVPVLVGPRRAQTGRTACARFKADTLVLDDGFQHRRLARDCDIVLIQARMPPEGWGLLPRGPMREPIASLRRADVMVVLGAPTAPDVLATCRRRLQELNPQATVVSAVHEPTGLREAFSDASVALGGLSGRRVGLVSSVGDPLAFEETIRRLGATAAWHQAFPDHHRYGAADWARVGARVQSEPVEALVTTEKDWVRLRPVVAARGSSSPVPCWILTVRLNVVEGAKALDARLDRLYAR